MREDVFLSMAPGAGSCAKVCDRGSSNLGIRNATASLETVYRRLTERLATAAGSSGAFRSIIDTWFYALEEDVLSSGKVDANDQAALVAATNELMEQRLDSISRTARGFAAALRGYRTAQANGDNATAEGLIAWVAGQPNVSATIKRAADLKGDVDHFAALSFLQGLLVVLRDSGHPGLLVVLDEVETLQRVRADVREKSLNALRQLIDEIDAGRFPGLFLVITGTPAFFDGPQGLQNSRHSRSVCKPTSTPTCVSTIRVRRRFAYVLSTDPRWWKWA